MNNNSRKINGDEAIAKLKQNLSAGKNENVEADEKKKDDAVKGIAISITEPAKRPIMDSVWGSTEEKIAHKINQIMSKIFIDYTGCCIVPEPFVVNGHNSPNIKCELKFGFIPKNIREELLKKPENEKKIVAMVSGSESKSLPEIIPRAVRLLSMAQGARKGDYGTLSDKGKATLKFLKYDQLKWEDCIVSTQHNIPNATNFNTNAITLNLSVTVDIEKMLKLIYTGSEGPQYEKEKNWKYAIRFVHFLNNQRIYTIICENTTEVNKFNREICGSFDSEYYAYNASNPYAPVYVPNMGVMMPIVPQPGEYQQNIYSVNDKQIVYPIPMNNTING